ncbi:MAG: hypothetical protein RLZZ436_482 [Planctomycetota bacterium]
MAKTWRHLFPLVHDWPNLVRAWQRCRRRKRYSPGAAEFAFDWEPRLLQMQRDLEAGTWTPGDYEHFYISEPKPRKISAAPFADRVVHHALVNVLEPLYERRFVFDSYACRRGKGTHRAIQRAQYYLRRFDWSLKTDIVRFFPSVDHELLMARLERGIRDTRLLALIRRIVDSGVGVLADEVIYHPFPGDDLFSRLRPTGLPIGNLTSQFFANVFLDPLDHYIRERLRVPGYVRYCDDLVLFGNSRAGMWEYRDAISEYLGQARLRLHSNKTHVAPSKRGVNFLGLRVQPNQKRLLNSSIRRFTRRATRLQWQLQNRQIGMREVATSIRAWLAHADHANVKAVTRMLLRRIRFSAGAAPTCESSSGN